MFMFIILSMMLFSIGTFGMFWSKKHMIVMLLSLELLLLACNMNFVMFSIFLDELLGQMYSVLMLTVAASETALGLALLVIYYRLRGGISVNLLTLLKS